MLALLMNCVVEVQKLASLKRSYSEKTLKVLFALSGNQCAHPECTNTVIEHATDQSDAHVSAHICHIYAISTDGPRGKSGLTQKELNAPGNLILLCRHHHGIVDGQHESYPVDTLKEWKQAHEAEMQKRLSVDLEALQPGVISHPYFPTALVDKKIDEEVETLRKTRFFGEVDRTNNARVLGRRLVEGELSGGTDAVRSRALAWCARLLAPGETRELAEEYFGHAKRLTACPEIDIAEAFIVSQKGDKGAALKILASIDSPLARSAALMVVAHHDGAEGALDWLKDTGINSDTLDSDGKSFLFNQQLELARWDAAVGTLGSLSDQDLANTPALHHTAAITCLLRAVPAEFRSLVVKQLPLDSANFPLASDAPSIEAREAALSRFSEAAEIERQLNCPGIASLDDEYALWLELRNPGTAQTGRKRLEDKLRDPETALQLVPLGLQFGIKFDLKAVEQEIEQNIALNGGITPEAAIARFALAFTQESPKDVAGYVERHYDDLSRFLGEKSLGALQIEALSRAGMPDKAEQRLSLLLEGGLSEEDEARLRSIIAEASGADPVELRMEQFKQTSALNDLVALVDELQAQENWHELCEFGEILFQRTRSVADAERLAIAFTNAQASGPLVEFLKPLPDLRQQSKNLQMPYCWALYNEGHLLDARSELAKLSDAPDDRNYRALTVNLGIALGDWPSLSAYVAAEYQARDNRSAVELIQTAQLAHHLGSPRARDLTFAAATKGDEDPSVLAAAYNLAATAGWEDDETVAQWIQKAAELSGKSGPIQRMTLKEFADRKPEWDRRESETLQMLGRGDTPMFLAGEALNRTLVNFMLFPALANLSERDPRRRGAIPAYSGQRRPLELDTATTKVGIDATALLTLSFLNLLDVALDAFDTVCLPHSTLIWLFEEKQKAAFHQPSRIRDAHQVRAMLATNSLEKLVPSFVADSDLSAQVGDNLAMLIAEAEKVREEDEAQHIVVRPSPVHRLGSLTGEEADLTEHASVITSCLAVVEKLRQKGQITADEEKKARAYLQLHEKPWPQQPDISDSAVLYLDDLSITNFLHLGVLDKLKAAGFTPVASPTEVSDSDALISYESNSAKVIEAIERIRGGLNSRIESGKITIGRQRKLDQPDEQLVANHPTVGALALAGACDAVIIDDRFVNQHANIDEGAGKAAILSTLDVLDGLVSAGAITPDQRMEYRTLLRRAGYFFIPVSDEELTQHLNACSVSDGELSETAELKAIRENLLRVRMSDWLQLPKEAPWVDSTIRDFIFAMRGQWKSGADLARVKVISDWIVDQIDIRGWAHRLGADVADDIVKTCRGAHILLLLTPPVDTPEDVKDAYWEWLEGSVLAPIKEQFSDLYEWIIERQKQQIAELADMDLDQGDAT
ncbi:MAG: PIN domain-containing protein [Magnetovibrionaceae bacterium]